MPNMLRPNMFRIERLQPAPLRRHWTQDPRMEQVDRAWAIETRHNDKLHITN
jgi:hypothetical protein